MLDLHRAVAQRGIESHWGTSPGRLPSVDGVVLFMPRSKARARYLMAAAASVCPREGRLVLAGTRRSGAASMRPELELHFGPVVDEVRARGCVALVASRGRASAAPPGEARFAVPGPDESGLEMVSLPGVFSHGRLDPGTGLLLRHLGQLRFSRALDWGCGCGALGAFLAAARRQARVDLADTDAMAVEAARRTLKLNGLVNARALGSVGFEDLQGPWDLVVSNPPFHREAGRDPGPAESLLAEASSNLTPDGRLLLVANSFLPYERPLERSFKWVRSRCEKGGYKVLEARMA
jgi:16S rRNA (guanine1207-N2)-methyltransferase